MKLKIILILLCAALAGFLASWLQYPRPSRLDVSTERVFHYPLQFLQHLNKDPHAGEKVYREYCAACHDPDPMIPTPAPRLNNKKAWQVYKKLGMPQLLKLVAEGGGAMPARGGCFECDDELLKKTIRYMLDAQH